MRKKCTNCNGAGRLWRVVERVWPDDGRDMPEITPTILRCHYCRGSGEEPTIETLRSWMIGQSP